ncbi:hypothetical protein SUNI508_03596 [Seiridium unicorne]|uniref:Polyketide synthase n=1 Tax=Seiridium unicorne TaxID=138068 RepID=A0ABR2VBU7_9PEZI
MEPIAVIGLGCRFPGDATSPQNLWDMLSRGESAWSEFPEDRLNIHTYYHPSGTRQGSICFRGAHFLNENVAVFDSSFFGIPPDEAKAVDPQQRLLLEVTVEALDSDYEQIVLRDYDDQPQYGATGNGTAILSNRLSYFLDICGPSMTIDTGCSASLASIHQAHQSLLTHESDMVIAGGCGLILTPNTMMPMTALNFLSPDGKSYTFDARANGYGRGEGVGVVILKRLSDAIRDNDNIRAVIRGSRLNQDGKTPGITLPSTEAQTDNMRAIYECVGIDPAKTMFVECHGTGTQAGDVRELKAISRSICLNRAKDNPVYVGSIKTNIGHLEGAAGVAGLIKGILTVENGVIPKHVNFETRNPAIHFHDWKVKVPINNTPWPISGLRRASINSFGFGGTNAHIVIDDAAHYLADQGLCAHHSTTLSKDIMDPSVSDRHLAATVLEVQKRKCQINQQAKDYDMPCPDLDSHVFVFSAHEQSSLLRMLQNQAQYLVKNRETILKNPCFLQDLAYTLGCRRTKLKWKTSVTAKSVDELVEKLQASSGKNFSRTSGDKPLNIAFVFSGQGAQWHAMGRELLAFDIYLESIAAASEYMTTRLGSHFSLLGELLKDEDCSQINRPEISHPATTAVQVALVDLLVHRCGIIPSSVVGHSSGEIAAAYASGMISRETAWELSYYRGSCASSLLQATHSATRGRMLAVGLPEIEADAYLEMVGKDRVVVACINSPSSLTLSGDEDAIFEIQRLLVNDGVFNRLLMVEIAYHSFHMLRCAPGYSDSIAHLQPRVPARCILRHPCKEGKFLTVSRLSSNEAELDLIPESEATTMFSSVTGEEVEWQDMTHEYWSTNLTLPVKFSRAISSMMDRLDGKRPDIVLEVGPHAVLESPLRQIFEADSPAQKPKYLSVLRRHNDATTTTLNALGELWVRGCNIAMPWVVMRNVQSRRPRLLSDLPNYPWNHDVPHWYESHLSRTNRLMPHGRYDLIGRPTPDSIPFQPRWRGFFRIKENPWIEHHQVQKTTVYPAAGMICMVLEGAKQLAPESSAGIEISQFRIEKAMLVPSTDHGLEYALNLSKQDSIKRHSTRKSSYSQPLAAPSISYEFSIYSKPLNGDWQQHGSGIVTIHPRPGTAGGPIDIQAAKESVLKAKRYYEKYLEVKSVCDDPIIPRQLYETLDVIGMNYGSLFRNISSLYKHDNTCTFVVCIPDTKSIMPAQFEFPHILHPATLDSVFQTAFGFGSDSMVPSYVGSVYVSLYPQLPSGAGGEFVGYAKAERQGLREANVTFAMSDRSWKNPTSQTIQDPLIIIKDMRFTALSTSGDFNTSGFIPNHHNLCSEMIWEPVTDTDANIDSDNLDPPFPGGIFLLVPDVMSMALTQLCNQLCNELKCTSVTWAAIQKVQSHASYYISLLELRPGHEIIWNWSEDDFAAFRSLVDSTKGLLWLTQSAQIEATNPKTALLQALARTIRSENPQRNLLTLDLGADTDLTERGTAAKIVSLFASACSDNSRPESRETDYAERGGELLVPRLVPMKSLNKLVERGNIPTEPLWEAFTQHQGRSLKLKIGEIGKPGTLYWDDDHKTEMSLEADTVAIKVLATGLSSLDVDVIMGHAQDHALGTDVYGVIELLGKNVRGFAIGDRVVAIARGSLRQQVRCHQSLVHKISEKIDSSIVSLLTPLAMAHYALHTLASLKGHHSILVHAGAGSFGQAAVRLAQHVGATVYASVTNDEQRHILEHDYQLPEERIFDGNSNSFIESIMRLTSDAGVNVIFDPTSDYRQSNRQCVSNLGHVVSLTKKDTLKGQLVDFTGKAFSISVIDFAYLIQKEPERLSECLTSLCSANIMGWLPKCCSVLRKYDWSDLPQAFATLAEDSQCGMTYCVPLSTTKVPIMPQREHHVKEHLYPDSTYVLAGQGGLGMHIAKMLEANGVKNIALLSRSGATSAASRATIAFLEHRKVNVKVMKVDICDRDSLHYAVDEIENTMPRVRGLFQCAASLSDAVFDTMTYSNWQEAVRPKTIGSWNLYKRFPQDMDFFIFLSSAVGVIGNRGQANYAAGNAFQDALARHIDTKGKMRSVSIDLGPVLGAGMLAENPRTLEKLKATGFFGVRLQDFERVVERAITGYTEGDERLPPQVVIGVGTGGLLRQNKPADPYWARTALFTHLNKVDVPDDVDQIDPDGDPIEQTTEMLLSKATTAKEAHQIVTAGLCTVLAASMGKQADDVDDDHPPSAYGVDSLIAVGVRTWVQRECNVDVSIFEVLSDTSISELSSTIVDRGGFGKRK